MKLEVVRGNSFGVEEDARVTPGGDRTQKGIQTVVPSLRLLLLLLRFLSSTFGH